MCFFKLEALGYNHHISNWEKQWKASDWTVKIEPHSHSWTQKKKLATFMVGLLAIGLIGTAAALTLKGSIGFKTAALAMAGAGAILVLDLAAVIYSVKLHADFVREVGDLVKENVINALDLDDVLEGRALDFPHDEKRPLPAYGAIIYRPKKNLFYMKYYQTEQLYKAAVQHYSGKKILQS